MFQLGIFAVMEPSAGDSQPFRLQILSWLDSRTFKQNLLRTMFLYTAVIITFFYFWHQYKLKAMNVIILLTQDIT